MLALLLLTGCAQPQPTVVNDMKQRQAEHERRMEAIELQTEETIRRYYATCQQPCPPLTTPATPKPTICLQTVDGVSVCP